MNIKNRKKDDLFGDLHRTLKLVSYVSCDPALYKSEKKEVFDETRLLSAEEHTEIIKTFYGEQFESKAKLDKAYFHDIGNVRKIAALLPVCEAIEEGETRNIISFGSGLSALEYLLKEIAPAEIKIVAADYDRFFMEEVTRLMPEIYAEQFDFYHDDPQNLIEKYQIDTVLMFGSACSMDDKTYVRFLKRLSESGVKTIFTFEAGIESAWHNCYARFFAVVWLTFWYLFHRDTYRKKIEKLEKQGMMLHSVNRTRSRLHKIYTGGVYCASLI